MSENSLFAILMRSPWWISILVAAVIGLGARLTFPRDMQAYAPFIALPFVITACISLWRQLRAPSAARVSAVHERVAGLGWRDFQALLEEGFRSQGHTVAEFKGEAADLELTRDGVLTLVAARRWKAAGLGVEVLRELEAARSARSAGEAICVALGAPSEAAQTFARENGIRLWGPVELAALLPRNLAGARARP